jgi:hypothetical protein
MEEKERAAYFTSQALARFVAAEGRKVQKVICHLWQNNIGKDSSVEIIDNVELHFGEGQKLTIACNENGDGLDAIDFDFKKVSEEVSREFDSKIRLFSIDASETKMWQDVIGTVLQKVKVTREDEYYKADAVMLDFGTEKREISIAPLDGLIIDYYEE